MQTALPSSTAEGVVAGYGLAWAPVIGGAVAVSAVTLVLVALGSGLGFASVSAWPNSGASATAFGVGAGIWLVIVHWAAAAFGGYLTGRLRVRSLPTYHSHEIFFRDTAHGFLAWALAAIVGAALITSAASSAIGSGVRAAATVAAGAAQGATATADPTLYFVDVLYRSDRAPAATGREQDVRAETARIFASGLKRGEIPPADRTYLAHLVSAQTGLPAAEAEKRVNEVIAQAKDAENTARQAADAARKAAVMASIFAAIAMAVGAFIAAAAAALGGGHRDDPIVD